MTYIMFFALKLQKHLNKKLKMYNNPAKNFISKKMFKHQ